MAKYILYHKYQPCAELEIDSDDWRIADAVITDPVSAPFHGHATKKLLKQWWNNRAVPASRRMFSKALRDISGRWNPAEYLAKNLAVSVSDTYWVCPEKLALTWDDVHFRNFSSFHDGKIPYHNATSYDPCASLGGQMEKYWDLSTSPESLVKKSNGLYGQQALNEVFATMIHERQDKVPFVRYTAFQEQGDIYTRCDAFTSERKEFVSAYELIAGVEARNEESGYELFIRLCAEGGISEKEARMFLDYQTLTDFILTNTDEHLNNFGILRDADTLEFLSPAPIFDSGNSMFYLDKGDSPLERHEILEREITSFHKREEKMLKHVRYKDIVDAASLPTQEETMEFYTGRGVPEEKASYIAANYAKKIEMLMEFQCGKTISAYLAKKEWMDAKREENA